MITTSSNASASISTLSECQSIENAVSNTNSVDSPIAAIPAPDFTSAGPAAFTRSHLHKRQAPPPPPSFIPPNGTPPSNGLNQPSRTGAASLSQSSEFPQARTIEQLLAHIPNVTFVAAPDELANSKLVKSTHTWVPTSGHLVFDEESRQPICEFLVDSVYYGKAKRMTQARPRKGLGRMVCDCSTSEEERADGLEPCGFECINRMLLIECDAATCPCGEYCLNRHFQLHCYPPVEPFRAGGKGYGLRALETIEVGTFVMEYVGELIDFAEFQRRVFDYEAGGLRHHYFMQIHANLFVDATRRGNLSRFMNHSCDPNCETQKWTVCGEVRVGFFARRRIGAGDELTFDYQYETYGTEAQKCLCGAPTCRGVLGAAKQAVFPLGLPTPADAEERDTKENEDMAPLLYVDKEKQELRREVRKLLQANENGLRGRGDIIVLCRLMLRVEASDLKLRMKLLSLLQSTAGAEAEQAAVGLPMPISRVAIFIGYRGLPILASWLEDLGALREIRSLTELVCAHELVLTLKVLPMPNKNVVKDSKLLSTIESWFQDYKLLQEDKSKSASPQQTPSGPTASESDSKLDACAPSTTVEMDAKQCLFTLAAATVPDMESKPIAMDSNEPATESTAGDSKPVELRSSGSPPIAVVKTEALSVPDGGSASAALPATDDKATGVHCAPSEVAVAVAIASGDAKPAAADASAPAAASSAAPTNAEDIRVYVSNIGQVCEQLLAAWSALREVFRIPRRQQAEQRKEAEKQLDDWTEAQQSKPQPPRPSANRVVSAPSGYPKYYAAAASVPLDPKASAEREQLKQLRRRAFEEQVRAEQEELRRRTEYHRLVEEQMKAHQQLQAADAYYFTVFIDHSTGVFLDPYTMIPIGRLAADGEFTLIDPSEAAHAHYNSASLEAFSLVLPPIQQQENQLEAQQQQVVVDIVPQQMPIEPNANEPPPLPPGWRATRDATGKVYYYHSKTRQTQWERPAAPTAADASASQGGKRKHKHKLHLSQGEESVSSDDSGDSDSDSQSLSEKGEFDATKSRFIKQVSKIVVTELSKYRHEPRYKVLLQNSQQFKSQARKMTHAVFKKEMQSVRGDWSELEVGAEVGKKTRSFVLKQLEHVARKTERRRARQSSDMIALYMQRMPERAAGTGAGATASDSRSPTDSQTDSVSACASGLGGPASDSLFGASASCVGSAPVGAPDSPGAHSEPSAHASGDGDGDDDEVQAAASLLVLSTSLMSPARDEAAFQPPQQMETGEATAAGLESAASDVREATAAVLESAASDVREVTATGVESTTADVREATATGVESTTADAQEHAPHSTP